MVDAICHEGNRGEKRERERGEDRVRHSEESAGRIDRSEINAPIRQEHLLVCADHVEQTRPRDRNTRLPRLLRVIHPMGCFNDDISGATGLVNLSTIEISRGISRLTLTNLEIFPPGGREGGIFDEFDRGIF